LHKIKVCGNSFKLGTVSCSKKRENPGKKLKAAAENQGKKGSLLGPWEAVLVKNKSVRAVLRANVLAVALVLKLHCNKPFSVAFRAKMRHFSHPSSLWGASPK